MEWRAASHDDAQKIIAAGIHCRLTGDGLRLSVISECLRAVSHLCSVPQKAHEQWVPTPSSRLTSMVRRRLGTLWPNLPGDYGETCPTILEVLNSLAKVGDMVRLEGGRWLAAPAHAVRASNGMAVLLGGGPRELLPHSSPVITAGRTRLIPSSACDGWAELLDAEDWIGAPGAGLESWSSRLLTEAECHLTDAPDNMGEVFVYFNSRWLKFVDTPITRSRLILCRSSASGIAGDMYFYFIGEFAKGRLRRLREIKSFEARRLRFHLDAQEGRPARVIFTNSDGLIKLKLPRRLPERESRVLLLGWRVPAPKNEHPGITHHVFPLEMLPIVRTALQGLRIVLDERCGANGGINERD